MQFEKRGRAPRSLAHTEVLYAPPLTNLKGFLYIRSVKTPALDIGATKIAIAMLKDDDKVMERLQIPPNVSTNI